VAATCGAGVAIADRLAAAGLTVTVEAGAAPVARLPMATVQFLVPGSLAFAKCDCSKGAGCEHVVLAVRGFRQRPDGGLAVFASASGAARRPARARARARRSSSGRRRSASSA
jgi:NAD(P)-dependent dehydrogenase (short-subunit alcohol dehydrogenase family)